MTGSRAGSRLSREPPGRRWDDAMISGLSRLAFCSAAPIDARLTTLGASNPCPDRHQHIPVSVLPYY